MTKHEAMVAYVREKADSLTFNFVQESGAPSCVSFLTNYAGKAVKKYVRGAEKEYGFVITLTWAYSVHDDDMNLMAMNAAQEFMDWIDEQNRNRNFPDFGDRCQVKRIENMQNMPNLATVDMENGEAHYQIPCRVLYFEKER